MRKILKLLAAGMMAASLMTGCGGDTNTAETTVAETTTTESGTEGTTGFTVRDYSNYVTLGDYKGISVSPITVTDEEIAAKKEQHFRDTVEYGDTVDIDYIGYLDGEAFEGGTAEGAHLTIGSGEYIDGFESGLVDVKIGETVDLNLTFPESYDRNPDMAGKEVVFTVTVNGIAGVVAPEYTLDNIIANTDCQTLEEYEDVLYDEIYSEYYEERLADIWGTVLDNATVSGYPQEEVDVYANEMADYYKQMANQYQMEFSAFLSAYGYTEETFEEDCQGYGQSVMNETMVLHSIAAAENMTVTSEEYHEEINNIVDQTGLDEITVIQYYGGEDYIYNSLLFSKVVEFLEEQSVEE